MYASSRPNNFTQRRQWANPRAFVLKIKGATDHHRLSVSEIQKKYMCPSLGKMPCCIINHPIRTLCLVGPNLPKEDNGPIPVLWYWILKELQTIIGQVNENINIFTLYHFKNYLHNQIIFQLNGFQNCRSKRSFRLLYTVLIDNCRYVLN